MKRLIAAFLIAVVAVMTLTSCSRGTPEKPLTKTNFLLDTMIQITAYGPEAQRAIDEAFDRINDIQKKMTVNGQDSEVIEINKKAGIGFQKVSPDTFYVIKKGLYYSEESHGRFDITIGPLVKLWGIGTDRARVPSQNEIKEALKLVNYKDVVLKESENSVMLKRPHMAIDLGAIAKGYAADEVVRILKENGIKSAAADLGGNIYVVGKKPNGLPWKIGIQDPFEPRGNTFATVEVADKTLVTSGVYERFFEKNGKRYHHILDTSTGYPVENGLVSVTIISDSSIDADGLSTTVFALGLKEGMSFVERTPNIEAVFVTGDRRVYTSSGINRYNFKITNSQYKWSKLN
ncbi:FAD:protein FMN transferase [Thermoanaerobacterium sp. DL9XJH110]|uniref:FAD:protein FMN transferase n=1 Tax=Thermoanaerobacterium sp. DL9XJH110 TaxID=3386643 RepID=UPI003BB52F14